ncbi:uncharacterized protein CELE_C08F8.3 [Caenorhabditis elegans]|uniref:Uncharacterized protein n=1 Tax=Caenorhabditis elegans TaxID=6239 RepID=Q17829_CAEEL|nr:Uncharacterized protein CELE_C08F8.3 [Caenorhabditis elegans]CAA97425.2 Uncharacterized protein CELE_C08F8.3 [Caenorhabditis elegans]|eukprot:NP_502090.2 Uncharacterized protein CELE_C08F8.3 [Caenorhabditis elegans]
MEQEFFFPPPKKSDGPVVACVVEKKGDGTRTSMRQNEIYAYSAQIRTGDGCMVMPKIHWNSFEPSDWVSCTLEYVNKANQIKEKEMLEISKVPAENFDRFGMPPTRFENGIVQIKTLFVACPEFIKNRETRNAYGSYKKLFILNIGLGFVSTRRTADGNLAEKVKNGDVYTGIFEFRAKDNGAINFNHRGRVRDETNHVIERDAMWELTKTSSVAATDVQKKQMKEAIEQLRKDAEQFEREFKDSQSRPVAPMLPPNEISENRKEINLGLALPSRHSQPSIRTVDVVTTTPAQMMPTASSFRIPFAQVSKAPVVAPSSQLQQQQQQPCSSNQTARIGNFLERDQVRGNLLGVPLSSSTPRGSPELLRRREVTADDGNITSNTAVMLRDNNANPMNRRRPS